MMIMIMNDDYSIGIDLGVFRVIVDTRIGAEWFPRLPRSLDDLYKEGSHPQLFSLAGAEPLISLAHHQ